MFEIPSQYQLKNEHFRFNRELIANDEPIDPWSVRNATFVVQSDQINRRMIASLRTWVASNEVRSSTETSEDTGKPVESNRETKTTKVPKTWWDHLKWTLQQWLWGKHIHCIYCEVEWQEITTTERVYLTMHTTKTITKHVHMCPHLQSDPEKVHVLWMDGRES